LAASEFNELLETLDEIAASAGTLTADLVDKKTISDVMLALEKILPDVKLGMPPKVGRLGEALALLYEKFLMEMVADGTPGLAATADGVELIRAAAMGAPGVDIRDARADEIAAAIADVYDIRLPEAAAAPVEEGADEEADQPPVADADIASFAASFDEPASDDGGDEDDFFGGARPPEQRRFDDEPGEPENPMVVKVSAVAAAVAEIDDDFSDKKGVSDIMLALEGLAAELRDQGRPGDVVTLASAVAGIFEKSIMDSHDDGARALALANDGLKALAAFLSGYEDEGAGAATALRVAGVIGETLGVSVPGLEVAGGYQATPVTSAPHEERKETPVAAAPVKKPSSPASSGRDRAELIAEDSVYITIATDEDLLLYTEFVSETSDTVATIEEGLLELEENPSDMDLINTLFRSFHSLKGAAGFLGLTTVNIVCHESESLLDKLRKKTLSTHQGMIDAFLQAVDVVKAINDRLGEAVQAARKALPDARLELPRSNIANLVDLLTRLTAGEGAGTAEDEDESGGEEEKLGDILVKSHAITEEQLKAALAAQRPVGEMLVDMGAIDKGTVEKALAEQQEKRRHAPTQVTALKVDTEKLDSLLELVGELVISQSIVIQDDALNEEKNRALQKNLANLGKITKNIQDHVMSLRMVPLKQTFQKMSRLVRDLSKKMNKPVHFEMIGEETEIDKTLIEELNDPLVHLMRNAIDHGVETPEERAAAGKASEGNVRLAAYHKGGNVYIEIADDGKGIDRDRILAKAIERGLALPGQDLTDGEIYNMIFEPGLSTAAKVTDVSGRGVGMDVVRSNIDRLGGRVEVASEKGKGSTLTVKLPLTMAIVDGMIVKIGEERFIIPTIAIRESIRPRKEEINTVKREGEMINIRGRLLPLIRLHNLLQVPDARYTNPWEGLVIIIESDDKEYGLMVDDLLGQQQVVIKSLGPRFRGLPGISGGTILGDGRVGLILDVGGVVGMN
jgi:two-component system chemotaxis sensor kinase CheA